MILDRTGFWHLTKRERKKVEKWLVGRGIVLNQVANIYIRDGYVIVEVYLLDDLGRRYLGNLKNKPATEFVTLDDKGWPA